MLSQEKLFEIMAEIFDLPASAININTSAENLKNWDSMAHINLILAIEGEIGTQFSPEEIAEMISAKAIMDVLSKK